MIYSFPSHIRQLMSALTLFLLPFALPAQTTGRWDVTWETSSINVTDVPKVIDYVPDAGYALATWTAVQTSSDGGMTWKQIYTSGNQVWGNGVVDLSYAAAGHIVTICDTSFYEGIAQKKLSYILLTTDGGTNWRRFDPDGDLRLVAVDMYDATYGVIAAVNRSEPTDSLLRTTDGGISWTSVPYPGNTRYARDIHVFAPEVWGMRAYDTQIGEDFFYRTTDGGKTWVKSVDPLGDIRSVTAVGSSVLWGVGGRRIGVGDTENDIIRKSTDGGITWETVLDSAVDFRFGLFAIDFADQMNGIAVGGYAKILRTTDGGESWHQEWPPSELTSEYTSFRDIAYPTVDEAIALGSFNKSIAYRGERALAAPRITKPDNNFVDHPLTTTLSWTPIEGATVYDVQVGDTAYDYNIVAHEVFDDPFIEETGLTGTSLELQLEPHVRYAIRVRARGAGLTSDWSVVLNLLTQGEGEIVATPDFTSPEQGATNQPLDLRLSWTRIADATGYDLMIGFDPTFFISPSSYNDIKDTTFLLTGLSANTTYYGRVRARNADGITSLWSSQQTGVLIFTTTASSSTGGGGGIDFAASIRPNVANDRAELTLSVSGPERLTIRLIDMRGEEILRWDQALFTSGTYRQNIDLSDIPAGRYLVAIERMNERRELPLIIVR